MHGLKDLRRLALLTLVELSEKSGVSVQTISAYESGRFSGRTPRFSTVKRLAAALTADPKEIWRSLTDQPLPRSSAEAATNGEVRKRGPEERRL